VGRIVGSVGIKEGKLDGSEEGLLVGIMDGDNVG
jgi:hypothetical protein